MNFNESIIVVIGDLINADYLKDKTNLNHDIIKQLKGNFILIHEHQEKLTIYQSLFAFIPIYYNKEKTIFSNFVKEINALEHFKNELNKRFVLESVLFNYPIFNQTFYCNIFRVPSFHYFECAQNGVNFIESEKIENWFTNNRLHSAEELADTFTEQCPKYFSQNSNAITFTGGFDGRSIVSVALKQHIKFKAYSCGRVENSDVSFPLEQSKILNVDFEAIDLMSDPYKADYLHAAREMTVFNSGFNGFLYPHFLYLAKIAKERGNDVLITGYCGSELFRALHIEGALTTKHLVDIFIATSDQQRKNIEQMLAHSPFATIDFSKEVDDLIKEIDDFKQFCSDKQFSKNEALYYYVFVEMFRKIFGSLLHAQFQYIKVRTPFLDYSFVSKLFQSEYLGAYNEFFIHNPIKRKKGQMVYPYIIKKNNTQLYGLPTNKGYSPKDLLSMSGNMKLAVNSFVKKFKKGNNTLAFLPLDNLGLISHFNNCFAAPSNDQKSSFIPVLNHIPAHVKELERDLILLCKSLNLYHDVQ
jgi:asparagine synthetase B (glutamine-hydrolysing)